MKNTANMYLIIALDDRRKEPTKPERESSATYSSFKHRAAEVKAKLNYKFLSRPEKIEQEQRQHLDDLIFIHNIGDLAI